VVLFNLEQDENERHDVAEANPNVVERLTQRVHDYWLSKDEGYTEPQINIPHMLANPERHSWTWKPFL